MNIKTDKGGFKMEARPAKLNIDTYAARASMGLGKKNFGDFYNEEAQRGIKLAYQGVARIADDGNDMARGSSPSDVANQSMRSRFSIETVMDFIPKEGAEFSYEEGVLNINYQVDDMNLDWENLEAARLVFNPGKVEINVAQYCKVEIEYVGDPIYVPPSASPSYVPVMNVFG
jgi:hypothetical protein